MLPLSARRFLRVAITLRIHLGPQSHQCVIIVNTVLFIDLSSLRILNELRVSLVEHSLYGAPNLVVR